MAEKDGHAQEAPTIGRERLSGPYHHCGTKNYPLFTSGPTICQKCSRAIGAERAAVDLRHGSGWPTPRLKRDTKPARDDPNPGTIEPVG